MQDSATSVVLKHKIYTDDYLDYLRNQAKTRALEGLNLEALDSCGASLGSTEDEIEQTRRGWEEKAQRAELDNVERTLRRQQEGLHVLLQRGGQLEGTSIEMCPQAEATRIAQGGMNPPVTKFTVYLVRMP